MRVLLVLTLLLVPSLVWATPTLADPAEPSCEEGLPPSGIYLEPTLARLFHYDCLTGILVPMETGPLRSYCNRDLDPTTGGGVCAEVTALEDGRYSWRFQVALISLYDENGEGTIQDEATREVLFTCPNTPDSCKPVAHGLVRWLDVRGEESIDCSGGSRTLFAQTTLWSSRGSIAVRGARADVC